MKQNIAILGSTGSIGKSLIKIISRDIKKFNISLLSANKNYKLILKQAKKFNVKYLIIIDPKSFDLAIKYSKNKKIKIFNNFNSLDKIFKKKNDYTMCAISGFEGLKPTYDMIKYSKKIAIANKESIVCGWPLLNDEIKKNKTEFIPIDSEHFSIWYGINKLDKKKIDKIYLTASGGPFLNTSLNKLDKIKIIDALNHPNWKMGRKISIDSATMMNKVLEIIEARNIFNIKLNKINILIHPNSYLHAIIKFNNGLIKCIAHATTMEIPIFNSLYNDTSNSIKSSSLNIDKLNNLNLKSVNQNKFPVTKLLKMINDNYSLFETIIVTTNDVLVNSYLNKKIKFTQISSLLLSFIKKKEFKKYKTICPSNFEEITKLNNYVKFKLNEIIR